MKLPRRLQPAWILLRDVVEGWQERHAPRMAAAIAFYTTFSFAPLLLLSIAAAGLIFGKERASASILAELHGLLGEAGARAVQEMIHHARQPGAGVAATVV